MHKSRFAIHRHTAHSEIRVVSEILRVCDLGPVVFDNHIYSHTIHPSIGSYMKIGGQMRVRIAYAIFYGSAHQPLGNQRAGQPNFRCSGL